LQVLVAGLGGTAIYQPTLKLLASTRKEQDEGWTSDQHNYMQQF
jgi:hypothetical protein